MPFGFCVLILLNANVVYTHFSVEQGLLFGLVFQPPPLPDPAALKNRTLKKHSKVRKKTFGSRAMLELEYTSPPLEEVPFCHPENPLMGDFNFTPDQG